MKELLPGILGRIAKESGRATHLAALWDELVGDTIARNTWPTAIEGGTLVITVASARWAHELSARESELCARVQEKLGKSVVRQLVFRLERPGPSTPRRTG
jgi:predicted nucleic acid-binding Zn ribbon protein